MKLNLNTSFQRMPKSTSDIQSVTEKSKLDGSKENNRPVLSEGMRKKFKEIFHKYDDSQEGMPQKIIREIHSLDCKDIRKLLQDYCLEQYSQLPLFLAYEIADEFNLQGLRARCREELINQNFQQLNYSKYSLIQLSFGPFQKLLAEHKALANNLQIYGLKQPDLKAVIDDYCCNSGRPNSDKQFLYEQYILKKNHLVPSTDSREVRRSMIELQKAKDPVYIQDTIMTPLRVRKMDSKTERDNKCVENLSSKMDISMCVTPCLNKKSSFEAAQEVRRIIEQTHEKQNGLYSEIVQISRNCTKDPNGRQIRDRLSNIQNSLSQMERDIQAQNGKIQGMKRDAQEILGPQSRRMDFVFKY